MKKKIQITAFVVVTVIGIGLILDGYGLFADIQISRQQMGPYVLVYEARTGDYKAAGSVMGKVRMEMTEKFNLECPRTFGLYYDNPETVETVKLRSIAGCIIERDGSGKSPGVSELKEKGVSFGVAELAQTDSIATDFPFKGTLSIVFGVMRVYPKLKEYIQSNRIAPKPIMELYDLTNEKITYMVPLDISTESLEKLLDVPSP
jgi:DNA gyrase inhibitor GyrI